MVYKKLISTAFLLAIFLSFESGDLRSQSKLLPLDVTCRKSTFEGSYVLQLRNTSQNQLAIWLDARETKKTFVIPAGKGKEIGWVQGFRFDANDIFFIGADGYDTIKQTMPDSELSKFRIRFAKGGLSINLSQSYLQSLLPQYLKLPVKQNVSNACEVRVVDMPQIILKDRSERIYANVIVHAVFSSRKIDIPINTSVSFVPMYDPANGMLFASRTKVENAEIALIPKEWMAEVTKFVDDFLPVWMSPIQIYQVDKTTLKYCKFFNVREINVQNGRLEIILL